MIPSIRRVGWAAALTVSAALLLAACGGTSTGTAATPSPSASATPTPTPTATAAAAPVVLAHSVGTMGIILVAASNNHTVYTFDSDAPGVSKCTGGGGAARAPRRTP